LGPDTYDRLVIQQAEHDVTNLAIILSIVSADQMELIENCNDGFKIQTAFVKRALPLRRIVFDFHGFISGSLDRSEMHCLSTERKIDLPLYCSTKISLCSTHVFSLA
jgi:hypothetical protein